ncbi:MAG: glutamate synthase subunit alpha, partial [Kiritimatiellae bacterium]|nr:glutamate synthase subunit alpha [Kiritimatiellia bacterium]
FGWSKDDVETILRTMAETGREPACATGDAASIAALARPPRSLFDCFRQNFAQVTNPPIDPVREELAMSIMTYIGNDGNMLAEGPEHARLVKMTRPVLTDGETERIKNIPGFPAATLGLYFDGSLRDALAALADAAKKAAAGGAKILVLSDKAAPKNATKRIPSVLAVAAANKALSETGARPSTGIVAETGEALEVHHFAVLLGFGATAVNPYLALETAVGFCDGDRTKAVENYIGAVCAGIMKIMSKMGVSTLRSYRSARIFETVGLGPEVVREWFGGAASSTGGMGMEDLEELTRIPRDGKTEDAAMRSEEERLWTPRRAAELREAVRNDDYGRFRRFTREIDECSRATLRSQLEFTSREAPVPPDAVEPVESIIKRFTGAAMSLGSISPEAHETIAIAMNGLGASSNSGEGGEDPARFGTNKNSAVKQIASARFGVTAGYVRSAKELQIKIAQGAKPGEGGRLPARKVDTLVAALRHSKPGVPLVSPPPHHDIYSIEDLAETIYDLKSVNPEAGISVKLVSQSGVGTVAAGVAKARAGKIVVSGFDGGTGAAPLSSVKHAGLPWETGLAEVRQTLEKNNLRRRVKLQIDGRLCTGRDIVVGTMLGADEFAFGTAMLVALGCVYCTKCNLDRCPAGIATQDKALRARFAGKPEHLQTYFRFLAREVRETLASIGFKSLDAIRGRADLLRTKPGARFDFRDLLACRPAEAPATDAPSDAKQDGAGQDDAGLIAAVKRGETEIERKIGNADRAVGAALSGWIVSQPRETAGLAATVRFTGSAGQSFGAFLVKGIRFSLHGEANDYVGK